MFEGRRISAFVSYTESCVKKKPTLLPIYDVGYKPQTIQTDNGAEFTHLSKTDRIHPFDILCKELNIRHQLIRPRTPWHNGKVERSHRNDRERFYNYLKFYSMADLQSHSDAGTWPDVTRTKTKGAAAA